jgi:alkaline phosphatase D
VRRTTRRELIVGATATALASAVPPAYARQHSRRVGVGPGGFADGVATGEPGSKAITFWSRLRTDHPRSGAKLVVATDSHFKDVVAVTKVPTGRGVNWTLKTRVGGLEPDQEYFYLWQSATAHSEVGRTRTMPVPGSITPLRIGFSSCQHYCQGYYGAHLDASRADLGLYLFLGDYIYERGRVPNGVRADGIDAVDLPTYRRKYQIYRSDEDLRALHRTLPMAHIWDDHEVENNYSDNNPAPAAAQRIAAYRAAFEWLPRMVMPSDRFRIYKQLPLGGLADVFLLDTRQYRTGDDDGLPRHIMDEAQMQWLINGLKTSRATWKIVANQVVVAQDPFNTGERGDQWDGYADDRVRLLGELERAGVRNVVFLTGDAHVFMCNYLASDFQAFADNRDTQVPAGVEYVGGSVTSLGGDRPESEVQAAEAWNQEFNGHDHGYGILSVTPDTLVTEYRRTDMSVPGGVTQAFERFTQPSGANRVTRETLAPSVRT